MGTLGLEEFYGRQPLVTRGREFLWQTVLGHTRRRSFMADSHGYTRERSFMADSHGYTRERSFMAESHGHTRERSFIADNQGHTRPGGFLWQTTMATRGQEESYGSHTWPRPGEVLWQTTMTTRGREWGGSRQKTMTQSSREELLKDHHKNCLAF